MNLIEARDLEKDPLRRFCRWFNKHSLRLKLSCIPDISKYDRIYLPEDKSEMNKLIVKRCRGTNTKTYVVQHGILGHKAGFYPLLADYFMCWEGEREKFVDIGMPSECIVEYKPEKPILGQKIKQKWDASYMAVFLPATSNSEDYPHGNPKHFYKDVKTYTENEVIDIIRSFDFMKHKPHGPRYVLTYKIHPKSQSEFMIRIWRECRKFSYHESGINAYDIINSANVIFCFKNSTIVKDCEVLGKTPVLIDG